MYSHVNKQDSGQQCMENSIHVLHNIIYVCCICKEQVKNMHT